MVQAVQRVHAAQACLALLVLTTACSSGEDASPESIPTTPTMTTNPTAPTTTIPTAAPPTTAATTSNSTTSPTTTIATPVPLITELCESPSDEIVRTIAYRQAPGRLPCLDPNLIGEVPRTSGELEISVGTPTTAVGLADELSGEIVPVAYNRRQEGVEPSPIVDRTIEHWLVIDRGGHRIIESIELLDTTELVEFVVSAMNEYFDALASGRYDDATVPLLNNGLSLDARRDLAPLDMAGDEQADTAAALKHWCETEGARCDRPDEILVVASIDGRSGEVTAVWNSDGRATTATFRGGEWEGSASVIGLPPLNDSTALSLIADLTGARTVVAQGLDGTIFWLAGGDIGTAQIPPNVIPFSDGEFLYWRTEAGASVATTLAGSEVCTTSGDIADLQQVDDQNYVAIVDRHGSEIRSAQEWPISRFAVDCTTGEETAIESASFQSEGSSRSSRMVGGRLFDFTYDAEGNGDVTNDRGISVNGDDHAGFHTFTADATLVAYGDYGGSASPHVTTSVRVRDTFAGEVVMSVELARPFGSLALTATSLVVEMPPEPAAWSPWWTTESLAIYDLGSEGLTTIVPTNLSLLHLG